MPLRKDLAWEPAISLEIGLTRTIAYFRDELAAPPAWLAKEPVVANPGGEP